MAVPPVSRRDRPSSPSLPSTPFSHVRPRYSHMQSVSDSATTYTSTVLSNGQGTKLNVVTRVVVEGKARPGQEGAGVRMYLKISLPLDNVQPGSTIPLFAEQKVKVLAAQVHPLDSESVPYNFSGIICPMLQDAVRALNLPAKSQETFQSAFDLPPPSTPLYHNHRVPPHENIPPVDSQYAGCILVSDYHISYVVPKVLLQYKPSSLNLDRSTPRSRRASIGERSHLHFMAAIDMWIPYLTTPPRSPYLLSIPTPKCLHNYIKLRINPTHRTSASMASVSSVEDDTSSWNVMSEPYVTRAPNRSRSRSWNDFADDESSDASTSGSQDPVLQGTFPSTEFLRVRWAKPIKTVEVPGDVGDGRRRVGVDDVIGELVCGIKNLVFDEEHRTVEGIAMTIQYKGTCKGIWHPSVATALGMDVGLRAKGCDVFWLDESSSSWEVNGGVGYTGFDTGKNPQQTNSPLSLNDSQVPHLSDTTSTDLFDTLSPIQQPNTSLLRAPLPTHPVNEYSFESAGTLASLPDSALSSVLSSQTPSETATSASPGQPITLHLNMNELVPPAKNLFTFSISGSIIIKPRTPLPRVPSEFTSSTSDYQAVLGPVSIPHFTVLAVKNERISTIVRNEMEEDDAVIDLHDHTESRVSHLNSATDIKTIRRGAFAKFSGDDSKVLIRSGYAPSVSRGRPATPSLARSTRSRASSVTSMSVSLQRPQRRGVAKFPTCHAVVMPILSTAHDSAHLAVRVTLHVPSLESEWLEFGFAHPSANESHLISNAPMDASPTVTIADASVDGVSVEYDLTLMDEHQEKDSDMVLGDLKGKRWLSWCRVHVGSVGGLVVVDYQVQGSSKDASTFMARSVPFEAVLPAFTLPVGRYEVHVEALSGYKVATLQSNFSHEQRIATGHRFVHSAVPEFFQPHISVALTKTNKPINGFKTFLFLLWALSFIGCALYRLDTRIKYLTAMLDQYADEVRINWHEPLETVTVTVTTTQHATLHTTSAAQPITESTVSQGTSIPSILTIIPSKPHVDVSSEPSSSPQAPTSTLVTNTPSQPTSTPTRSYAQTSVAQEQDSTDTDSTDTVHEYSLSLPTDSIFHSLPFTLPWMDDPEVKVTLRRLAVVADRLWHLVRRAYHYPMNPP